MTFTTCSSRRETASIDATARWLRRAFELDRRSLYETYSTSMSESRTARSAQRPKRPSPVLEAIGQAFAMVARLPESEQTRELLDRCLAYEHIAQIWARELPTPEEREDLMKRIVALQVLVTRAYRAAHRLPAA
jgi:hypothetical protein